MPKILPEFPRFISYGHRAMYLGPAAIMAHKPCSVIDIACGDGFGYHALMSHQALSTYFGIDMNPAEIEKGQRLLVDRDNHKMVAGSWLDYPDAKIEPADFVFCIEVLEHVPQDLRKQFVEKCVRFAKKNIFFSTPPVDQNTHGVMTIPQCCDLLAGAGLNVVPIDVQWTTMYVCTTGGK